MTRNNYVIAFESSIVKGGIIYRKNIQEFPPPSYIRFYMLQGFAHSRNFLQINNNLLLRDLHEYGGYRKAL